jgi:hypothetical protein
MLHITTPSTKNAQVMHSEKQDCVMLATTVVARQCDVDPGHLHSDLKHSWLKAPRCQPERRAHETVAHPPKCLLKVSRRRDRIQLQPHAKALSKPEAMGWMKTSALGGDKDIYKKAVGVNDLHLLTRS